MKSLILPHVTEALPALIAVASFMIAYALVVLEEVTHLKKSKPLVFASGVIWTIVAILAQQQDNTALFQTALHKTLVDYTELLLFVLVAITYINVLTERQVFSALRGYLVQKGFSYFQLFWIIGILAFFLSALADNLTTALVLSAIALAIGKDKPTFTGIVCINIVVAANAGGAFSPFGDITTLMVWQAGLIPFVGFFKLFLPSVVNFLVPALCMSVAVPKGKPSPISETVYLALGGKTVIILFLFTICTTVFLQSAYQIPPALGMMCGLAYLQLFSYYTQFRPKIPNITFFTAIKDLDWDTLLFFYGIIMSIGGLATLGYLEVISNLLYNSCDFIGWDLNLSIAYQHTPGNIVIGLLSAILDNIPLMFSVITMNPAMSEGQWLLLTLTAGVGGSLLSIGSAAGVGVMGQAPTVYTFFTHLKWTWAILLGYLASVLCHLWLNAGVF